MTTVEVGLPRKMNPDVVALLYRVRGLEWASPPLGCGETMQRQESDKERKTEENCIYDLKPVYLRLTSRIVRNGERADGQSL